MPYDFTRWQNWLLLADNPDTLPPLVKTGCPTRAALLSFEEMQCAEMTFAPLMGEGCCPETPQGDAETEAAAIAVSQAKTERRERRANRQTAAVALFGIFTIPFISAANYCSAGLAFWAGVVAGLTGAAGVVCLGVWAAAHDLSEEDWGGN